MGLRDRDYTHIDFSEGKKRRKRRKGGWSVTGTLIFINIVLWFANGLFFAGDSLTRLLLFREEYVWHLSACYRLLSYGFAHSPSNWMHIAFNMFGLLMFGYGMMLGIGPNGFGFVRSDNIEESLGKREFLAFYLLTILLGGIVFALVHLGVPGAGTYGASGGVCGVVILYAWLFPRKTLYFFGILPVPMWILGIVMVIMDALGAAGVVGCGIAFSVHLAGAAFGTLYYHFFYKRKRTLTGLFDFSSRPKRKPKSWMDSLEKDVPKTAEEDFNRRLDEILKRYGEVGESGLTAEEREFLQQASRKYSEKKQR
jgi:membrane associated rhomboid family serine protease